MVLSNGDNNEFIVAFRNEYLMTILVKIPRNQGKLPEIKATLVSLADRLVENKPYGKVNVMFDVDPV